MYTWFVRLFGGANGSLLVAPASELSSDAIVSTLREILYYLVNCLVFVCPRFKCQDHTPRSANLAAGLARLLPEEFLDSPPTSLEHYYPDTRNLPATLGDQSKIIIVKSTKITMAGEERRSTKRSRFDQTEPEPKRASRFDRRSRSPSNIHPDRRRSRSPLAAKKASSPAADGVKSPSDPAAAAGRSMFLLPWPLSMLTSLRSCRSCSYQRPNPSKKRHPAR